MGQVAYMGDTWATTSELAGFSFFLLQETGNESILPCDRPLVNNLYTISARRIRFSFIFSRFGFSSNQEICMSCSLRWREIR